MVRLRVREMRAALTGPEREVLVLFAVLGHSFPMSTIAALAGPEAAGALDRLVGERLLVERPDGYDFAHPLLQEAVYQALGVARRRELHERAGRTLLTAPLAVRAYHLARGALPGDLDAVAGLRAAAEYAARLQAHREALGHLRAALELTPRAGTGTRVELLDETAWLAAAAADHTTGIAALTELADQVADDPVRLAQVQMRLASFLSTGAADVAAANRAASTAVRLLPGADAGPQLAAALNERAWIRGMAGDFAGQLAGCREALAVAEDAAAGDDVV